jgi:nucleoside-diphosphate-sugar epimerase
MVMKKDMKRILVTGANGQIGSELTVKLREKYGGENVIASDIKAEPNRTLKEGGEYLILNVACKDTLEEVIKQHDIDTVFHLAAILSAVGEKDPAKAWNININGLINVMNTAVEQKLSRVFVPSSIAVWGEDVPSVAPQDVALHPATMYGVTKVTGEVLADYYVRKYGLDVRGLRYPGIISSETLPGGGTTDYAVAIYYAAVKDGHYECFVNEDTRLPMMYMPDCIKATIDLMEAEYAGLKRHSDYNVGSMSFTAKELANSIRKYIPDFEVEYAPDYRQDIADSWPNSVDDSAARKDWGWSPDYDLDSMTRDMIDKLNDKKKKNLI